MAKATLDPSKEARAVVKYLRISPRKARLAVDAIRRKPVNQAVTILMGLKKKAARLVEKGLKSAVANAKGKGLEESRLVVSEIKADGGPTMKRFMSRSMGRADQILKRSTHLTVVLREGQKAFGFAPKVSMKEEEERPEKKSRKPKVAREGKTLKKQAAAAAA